MSSSNFLKKLRNRMTRSKKSYDIETPGAGGHSTVLLRRYDRVPSMYGDGSTTEHPNILRDFVPPAQTQSPGRYRGDLTLPRHFRFRSGHHRTQSSVSVPDRHEDIDLYNAIGDHRRSSCSCACANSARKQIPFVPPANNTVHMTLTGTRTSSPGGKSRNAAKDPLPPIVKTENKKHVDKEHERLKHEGKFAVAQDETPRYIGIDDYSNVDFEGGQPSCIVNSQNATNRDRSREEEENPVDCDTLKASPKNVENKSSQKTLQTLNGSKEPEVLNGIVCDESVNGAGAVESRQSEQGACGAGNRDVLDGYSGEETGEVVAADLPVPHKSCRGGDQERTKPIKCERRRHREDTLSGSDPELNLLSRSAPTSSMHQHFAGSVDDASHYAGRGYPHNSGYHEYKEAHQVLRATSVGKIVNLHDIEVSSSVEDLYARVPKGTAKTPDTDDFAPYSSDPNTDNEDDIPPPPIPIRNYRTESCCPMASQLSAGPCSCSHVKDIETGEELIKEQAPSVIHKQPVGFTGEPSGSEPIHMTLEEVWEDARARGIPMEKPATMTLHRRQKSASSASCISPTQSPLSVGSRTHLRDPKQHKAPPQHEVEENAKTGKGKFKLKNIFRRSEHDPCLSPPTVAKLKHEDKSREESIEDLPGVSDTLDTSGEASLSELSESVGNTSHCSSTDSGMEDLNQSITEPTRTINADFIESLRKLKDCGWYWGPLSWDGAEARLDKKPDGSFLVRDSSDDRYILSISFRSQGTTHHTRIEHYKGTFSFFSQPKSHGAGTIIEFIEKAMEHSRSGKFLYFLRPRAPGFPPAPVQLLYPVSRFRIMQSLQHMCRFEILRATRYDHIDKLPLPQKVKDYLRESQYYTEYILDQGEEFMPL